MKTPFALSLILPLTSIATTLSAQVAYHFSTGDADGQIATIARPGQGGQVRAETADDFVLSATTDLTSASFTGLLPSAGGIGNISQVGLAIYRVFPADSTVPASSAVVTRTNSPSDVALLQRDSMLGTLSFSESILSPTFQAINSVADGINPVPNYFTGGEGPVDGIEARIDLTFDTAITLTAGHYFFAPTVTLADGNFYWLSASHPIGASGTPFLDDFETQIRNEGLSPDWLRVGTDIVGGKTYNAAFTLDGMTMGSGSAVPEPATYGLFAASALLGLIARQRSRLNRS